MKKILSFVLILALSAAVITGCSQKPDQTNTQKPQSQTAQQTGQNEQSAVSSGESAEQAPAQNAPDTSSFIGEEKAKAIALERAGIAADGVIFDRVELDRDNGIWQYEVDFRQGRTEYDVDIRAEDGTVISFETDYDD